MIFGGIYMYLMASGVLPKKPKNPEKMELWRKKYGKFLKIAGPIVTLTGVGQFFGLF